MSWEEIARLEKKIKDTRANIVFPAVLIGGSLGIVGAVSGVVYVFATWGPAGGIGLLGAATAAYFAVMGIKLYQLKKKLTVEKVDARLTQRS
jgi:hypothetical protein